MKHVLRQFYPLLIAVLFGVLCTVVSSYLLVLYSSPPVEWLGNMSTSPSKLEKPFAQILPQITHDTKTVSIISGSGIGFKTFGISTYSGDLNQHGYKQLIGK